MRNDIPYLILDAIINHTLGRLLANLIFLAEDGREAIVLNIETMTISIANDLYIPKQETHTYVILKYVILLCKR